MVCLLAHAVRDGSGEGLFGRGRGEGSGGESDPERNRERILHDLIISTCKHGLSVSLRVLPPAIDEESPCLPFSQGDSSSLRSEENSKQRIFFGSALTRRGS